MARVTRRLWDMCLFRREITWQKYLQMLSQGSLACWLLVQLAARVRESRCLGPLKPAGFSHVVCSQCLDAAAMQPCWRGEGDRQGKPSCSPLRFPALS